MHKFIIAGIGTDVGKTVVAAVLATLTKGDYWKPIQCGPEEISDTATMKKWLDPTRHHIFEPAYSLKHPLSPHHAARLEGITLCLDSLIPPQTTRPLIIEGVGGIFVPLTAHALSIDLFKRWDCRWIIVSKHYLGSINHTLLTVEALKQQNIPIAGLIFNGEHNPDSEGALLEFSQLPLLGRLLPEERLDPLIIQRYARQWQPSLAQLIP